ncbi:origin recognition complex subunit Orc5 [Pseudomassariella vexata]|uniref:Origin recognition complex subunit Orc5 n=1 Tax=Pseudomassariella vexata TaxID=1141098 RepID=A0A1Y2DXY6_9PEZI|nr:origin recognition complex subunit Orc5 [Pseudomassariella vexata]ORY64170.1 origin recognition complex subunit Orc5 [Pseudomassariella vexata]
MSNTLFQLPSELVTTLFSTFPCREPQIRALATLVYPHAAPCRNLIIHGTEATGKSAITANILKVLRDDTETDLNYAIVKSSECVTARHLFERTIGAVADALQWDGAVGRCETLAALTVELSKMLKYKERGEEGWRFVLVFDAIDRQREAPPTLLPALARLSEIIPNLITIFILTSPTPSLLRTASTPHLHFPPYTKSQYTTILSASPPPPLPNTTAQETTDLYTRFAAAVHDSLTRSASRTLPSLQQASAVLWPRFTAPVAAGTHKAREFSKLLIVSRAYFQDETVLEPGIVKGRSSAITTSASSAATVVAAGSGAPPAGKTEASNKLKTTTDLANLLPPTARLLLIAAYLSSHNAPRHDLTLFSTWHHGRRKRGGAIVKSRGRSGNTKHRKIARKLLGPGVFVLERMVAIYAALRREWVGDEGKGAGSVDGDVGMAVATLASLRLVVRVGGAASAGGNMDRGGRWRVGVGWEVVRGVGRSLGVEVEEWLLE